MYELARQRLKYLIDHGELYPQSRPPISKAGIAIGALLVVLQIVDIAFAFT